MRVTSALVILLLASPAFASPKKTLVMPVQGSLSAEVAAEMTEQIRAQTTSLAPTLGLLVMTKKTFEKAVTEKRLGACKDSDCDVDVAQRLGTDLVVSSKILKVDDKFVLTAKLFDVPTGAQMAVKNADASSAADALAQGPKTVEALLRSALASSTPAAVPNATPAPPPARAQDIDTVLLDGRVAFGKNSDLFGKNGELTLYANRLVFQANGLNFNTTPVIVMLSEVTYVDTTNDEVQVSTSDGNKYRFTAPDNANWLAAIQKQMPKK